MCNENYEEIEAENFDNAKSGKSTLRRNLGLIVVSIIVVVSIIFDIAFNVNHVDLNSVSTISSSTKILGKQRSEYDNPYYTPADSFVCSYGMAPSFYVNTVIEARVIEILPDIYINPGEFYHYNVVRLKVIDAVLGEGIPDEVYLRYAARTTNPFEGYDTFLFSLRQIGIENFMMINDSKHKVEFFSHMFEVEEINGIEYGSVIAFNGGIVDLSFLDKIMDKDDRAYIEHLMTDEKEDYPVVPGSSIAEAKEWVIDISGQSENFYLSKYEHDFVTADDVFKTDEAKQIMGYVAPSEMNIFRHTINTYKNKISASYKRIINGIETDEVIRIQAYGDKSESVSKSGNAYTDADLSQVPHIGEVIENMPWTKLDPPTIEFQPDMILDSITAYGVYRKAYGEIVGIVRICWFYEINDDKRHARFRDTGYWLYDRNGNGQFLESDELISIIGDDGFVYKPRV